MKRPLHKIKIEHWPIHLFDSVLDQSHQLGAFLASLNTAAEFLNFKVWVMVNTVVVICVSVSAFLSLGLQLSSQILKVVFVVASYDVNLV